jgi:outer membrane protein
MKGLATTSCSAALGACLAALAVTPALGQTAAEPPQAPPAPEAAPEAAAGAASQAAREAGAVAQAGAAEEPAAFELREAPERELTGKEALAVQPGGLTADQVARRALRSSPELRARQAEIDAASAKIDQAIAQLLPRLTLKGSYTRISPVDASLGGSLLATQGGPGPIVVGDCPAEVAQQIGQGQTCALVAGQTPQAVYATSIEFPTPVNHYTLNASLAIPISDYILRLSDTLTATRKGKDAAEVQKRAEAVKVASDARVAYYNWLRAKAAVAVAKSSALRFRAMLEDARSAFALGTATKADVLRLEAAVASTELAVDETRTFQQLAEEQLAIMMNEPVSAYQVGEDVLQEPEPASAAEPSLDDMVKGAYQKRLELKGLEALSRSLEAGSRAARVGQWPRLDAFGDVTYANPNTVIFPLEEEWNESWAVGVALSYTLNDSLAGAASGSELEANLRKAEADLEALRRGIKLQVTSAYFDVRKARTAIRTAARGQAAAREAYRVATDLYRVGRATTTDLMSAESDLVAASLKEVDAMLDFRIASVRLRHATGQDVSKQ